VNRSSLPAAALVMAAVLASACIPSEGPMMLPGSDCLECHGGGGGHSDSGLTMQPLESDDDGPRWTFAGTVFSSPTAPASGGVRGALVHATDANGRAVTIRSNEAGNFYLADGLAFPLRVSIERGGVVKTMPDPVEYGGCNGCHTGPGHDGAHGRLAMP
jgi:hypothetical protein